MSGIHIYRMILAGCAELSLPDEASLLFPGFQRSEVVGFVAGLGATFAALPDLIGMLKRRSIKGMVEPGQPGSAKLEDVPEPDLRNGSVIVEAIAVGVCGTDVEIAEGK